MKEVLSKFFMIVIATVFIFLILALFFALPFMWLWNWLMPEIFGLTTISFWQSFGLLILAGFLFKDSSRNKSS